MAQAANAHASFRSLISVLLYSVLLPNAGSIGQTASSASPAQQRYQAVWVDAFHDGFKTPQQTQRLIEWARRHNVNALFVEVRKAGDAYYRSTVEPVANDISPSGYDPLADLIAQAHDTSSGRSRIEIHAWLIVYRITIGGRLAANHIARRHRDWLSRTYRGASEEDGQSFLDPGVPGVVDHTDEVVADLVSHYDLDGVHFDRLRYTGKEWGYNPIAVARFRAAAGRWLRPRPDDAAWSEFRRQQVSMMLRRLFIRAKTLRPNIKVSAATIAFESANQDFTKTPAFSQVFQDWRTWVRGDLLDIVCPMTYKRDHVAAESKQYTGWLDFLALNRGTALAVVGQGSYVNSPDGSLRQIGLAFQYPELSGVCLFSYAQLARRGDRSKVLTEALRTRYFRPGVQPPQPMAPEKTGCGWIAGQVVGRNVDRAEVVLATEPPRPTHADGSGFFAFMRVPVGEYQVSCGRAKGATQTVRVAAGKVAWARLTR